MTELLNEVKNCVIAEYGRASENYNKIHHSMHESYAVLLEEYEETQELNEAFKKLLDTIWSLVKSNNLHKHMSSDFRELRDVAEHAAAEWIQVAAMCHKARLTLEAVWETEQ